MVDLGTGTSFNVSSYPGYQSFTIDNFIISTISISSAGPSRSYSGWSCTNSPNISLEGSTLTKNYNSSTGILSLSGMSPRARDKCDNLDTYSGYGTPTFRAYLVIGT